MVRLVIQGTPRKGFHTYPLTKQYADEKETVSKILYGKNDDLQPLWPVSETAAESVNEQGVGFYFEHRKPFTWTQELYVKPDAKPGPGRLHFTLHVEVCDESCLFGDHEFDIPFTVIDSPVVAATPGWRTALRS